MNTNFGNYWKSVHVPPESLFTFNQNWCSPSAGITVHLAPEYAAHQRINFFPHSCPTPGNATSHTIIAGRINSCSTNISTEISNHVEIIECLWSTSDTMKLIQIRALECNDWTERQRGRENELGLHQSSSAACTRTEICGASLDNHSQHFSHYVVQHIADTDGEGSN